MKISDQRFCELQAALPAHQLSIKWGHKRIPPTLRATSPVLCFFGHVPNFAHNFPCTDPQKLRVSCLRLMTFPTRRRQPPVRIFLCVYILIINA